ncbi:hypothetical protein Pcinc_033146 [Petrolisthes cinctipes]|uniref:Uncharacterized protein n=1 Tax=Petrolisthes cinctipes TaxID=88211 RepID=A0AAE1JXZ6_PETCI|nr:hypothetical protein Pcinc_033146 [Petrolisthes cinctipes]
MEGWWGDRGEWKDDWRQRGMEGWKGSVCVEGGGGCRIEGDRGEWKDGGGDREGWKDGRGVWGVGCRIEGDRGEWKDGGGDREGWKGSVCVGGGVGLMETEGNGRMVGETERDGRMDGGGGRKKGWGWGRKEGWWIERDGRMDGGDTGDGRMVGECGGWGVGLRETERDGRMDGGDREGWKDGWGR